MASLTVDLSNPEDIKLALRTLEIVSGDHMDSRPDKVGFSKPATEPQSESQTPVSTSTEDPDNVVLDEDEDPWA